MCECHSMSKALTSLLHKAGRSGFKSISTSHQRLPATSATRISRIAQKTVSMHCSSRAVRCQSSAAGKQGVQSALRSMSVSELKERLEVIQALNEANGVTSSDPDAEDDLPQLIDVREPFEQEMASLPGFTLLPTSRFYEWGPQVAQLLDPQKETIVLCHHGIRSMQVAQYLVNQGGFQSVYNVSGGIDAYSRIDPSVPMY